MKKRDRSFNGAYCLLLTAYYLAGKRQYVLISV
jgi:uncharacterized protein YdaU (DUF1376 family)